MVTADRHLAARNLSFAGSDGHQLEADEALTDYKGRKNLAISATFFPNGRQEDSRATLLTTELLLTRAATHAATLGTDFDAPCYAGFLAAFVAARTGAGDEQSAKARAEAATHRQALIQRLTDAVKLVAAHYLCDATRAQAYFRIELLQAKAGARQAPPAPLPPA